MPWGCPGTLVMCHGPQWRRSCRLTRLDATPTPICARNARAAKNRRKWSKFVKIFTLWGAKVKTRFETTRPVDFSKLVKFAATPEP
eukprot:4726104-Prymnesium_polylepis.1